MRALQFDRYGEPVDVISSVELPLPEPQPGEVRLRLVRSPIHNHDLATIRGTYGVKPPLPAVGGSEMLGVVDAAGAGVSLAPGARVATTVGGAWAEFVVTARRVRRSCGRGVALGSGAAMQNVFAFALSGDLPLPVGGEFAFAQAGAALAAAERPGRAGKILLAP